MHRLFRSVTNLIDKLYLFCHSFLCCIVMLCECVHLTYHEHLQVGRRASHTHAQGKWLTHGACNTGFVCASTLRLLVILSDKHLSNAENIRAEFLPSFTFFLFSRCCFGGLSSFQIHACLHISPLSYLFNKTLWLCVKLWSFYKQILESPEWSNLHCKYPLSCSLLTSV